MSRVSIKIIIYNTLTFIRPPHDVRPALSQSPHSNKSHTNLRRSVLILFLQMNKQIYFKHYGGQKLSGLVGEPYTGYQGKNLLNCAMLLTTNMCLDPNRWWLMLHVLNKFICTFHQYLLSTYHKWAPWRALELPRHNLTESFCHLLLITWAIWKGK